MDTNLGRRKRATTFRRAGWLAVASMTTLALFGPGSGAALAGGPGSEDNLPNSGHTSNTGGLIPTMVSAVMYCSDSVVGSLTGSFTLSGTGAAGTYVVIYLTPNNGSNADPVGNVENNEVTVPIAGKSGTVPFTLTLTSSFSVSKGGILAVFAKDQY